MNTSQKGSLLQGGLIFKPIRELAPPLYNQTYTSSEERRKETLEAHAKLVTDMYKRLQPCINGEYRDPTWIELSKDTQTLHALMAINTNLASYVLNRNMQKAKDSTLPKSVITIMASSSPQRQPSTITIAPMQTDTQKTPTTPTRIRVRIGRTPPSSPKLVRTESGPLQAAIDALRGSPPTKKQKEEGKSKGKSTPDNSEEELEEEELQATQPVSSSKTLKKGRKSGATASKTQEPQGKSIQDVTMEELEDMNETLRVKKEAEKIETRITRATMKKWTKDPKIKDQVHLQL